MIKSIGNNGAKSSGPIGCFVPGFKGGLIGSFKSATRLYHCFGTSLSFKKNLLSSLIMNNFIVFVRKKVGLFNRYKTYLMQLLC